MTQAYRHRQFLSAVLIVAATAGGCDACRRSSRSSDPLLLSLIPLRHGVIDPRPLTGADCCTDVLALGDINGDGHSDVVLGAQESSGAGLVWYEFPTWQRHEIARGEFTTDGKTADLDRDGDQDIVVGDIGTGVSWFENLENGRRWNRHAIGAGYVHDIVVGNVDSDEDAEIVTSDKKEVTVWNRSASQWTRQVVLVRDGEGIALADVDGDGTLDIIFGANWLQNPRGRGDWQLRSISTRWPADTRVSVGDLNGDSRPDVILTASEGRGRVSWYEAPRTLDGDWSEHAIADVELVGAHSLIVADLDGDKDVDVVAGEMHTSESKRILIFVNDGRDRWRISALSSNGSHNMQAADFDGDGDVDIVGKNYGGPDRTVEYWENLTSDNFSGLSPTSAPFLANGWRYTAIDDARDDDQQAKMGLLVSDVNQDGRSDVVAGSFAYLNPGGDLSNRWTRTRTGRNVDVFFALDVDGDPYPDLIGARQTSLLWLEATDSHASQWIERVIGQVPDARTQGYQLAQIESGGHAELVFTRGQTLRYVRVPSSPETEVWPQVVISSEAEEEGVTAADIDRDGDLDLAATQKGGQLAVWFENPGTGSARWGVHRIGTGDRGERWLDRVVAADVNQDGRVDVLVSEETQDWAYNASIYWFEAPLEPRSADWTRHRIAVLRSANSLDVTDIDRDGDADVVAAEHTDMRDSDGAPNNLTVIYENIGRGSRWRAHPIEAGSHSSHLGARVFDLDGDGGPEIVSLGWNQFRRLHLWFTRP